MVPIAPRARIRHRRRDRLPLPVVLLPSTSVRDLDLAAAVLGRVAIALPGRGECDDPVGFSVHLAAGAGGAVLVVEGRDAIVGGSLLEGKFVNGVGERGGKGCCSQDGADDDGIEVHDGWVSLGLGEYGELG